MSATGDRGIHFATWCSTCAAGIEWSGGVQQKHGDMIQKRNVDVKDSSAAGGGPDAEESGMGETLRSAIQQGVAMSPMYATAILSILGENPGI